MPSRPSGEPGKAFEDALTPPAGDASDLLFGAPQLGQERMRT